MREREEVQPPQLLGAAERSAPVPLPPPVPRRRQERGWKERAVSPGCLFAVGAALLAVGAALVAAPLAMHAASRGSPPAPLPPPQQAAGSGLDAEGVPLGAAPSAQQQEGELVDCSVALADREGYEAAAAAAEVALLGGPAASLPAGELQEAVGGLPPLLFGTVFWVLVSGSHTWQEQAFPALAAAQVKTLNAAFAGLKISFRLDAVVAAPAASDADVEQCSSGLEQLAARLLRLPTGVHATQGEATAAEAEAGFTAEPDPGARIHVIVCEPEGVRGAAAVLGDTPADGDGGSSSGGSAAAGTILLRRSALWLSHTSMVHQLGHFFGLPHPFPDERQTCKLDGDGVFDTPLQYAPNRGCPQDDESDLHVCQASGDGPLPTINFMDLTNDTCRRHFTPGQAARMQALLRTHRPQLFAAAAVLPQPQHALVLEAAWQSGPPLAAVQAQQVAAAAAAAAASAAAGGQPPSAAAAAAAAGAAAVYASPWSQAALAANGQESAAMQDCACLGPDAAGQVFWTGQLNASYRVDAVRMLLPVQLHSSSSGGGGGGSDGGGSTPSSADDSTATAAAPAQAAVGVEIRVGESLDHTQNQRCHPSTVNAEGFSPLLLRQPLQTVACQPPVVGRFLTVVLAAAAGTAGAQQQQQQLCLCEVQPLSVVAPALATAGVTVAAGSKQQPQPLPAVRLNLTAHMVASHPGRTAAHTALAAGPPMLGPPACSSSSSRRSRRHSSSTSSRGDAWWSVDTGLDGAWVRRLRLSVPFACQTGSTGGQAGAAPGSTAGGAAGTAAAECLPAGPANLTVYVGHAPTVQLLADGEAAAASRTQSLCATGVAAFGGQPLEADCGRLMHGRFVTVVMEAPALTAQPQRAASLLSLCGVEVLGAEELLPGQIMSLQPPPGPPPPLQQQQQQQQQQQAAHRVNPPELEPFFTLPVDGDTGSCLEAPAGSAGNASWQLQLDGSYPLLAVRLAVQDVAAAGQAAGAAAGNGSSSLAVSLVDGGGGLVASWAPRVETNAAILGAAAAAAQAAGGSRWVAWELPSATPAAAVRVEGFASLCEVQLLAARQQPLPSYQLLPTAQWSVLGAEPSSPGGGGAGPMNSIQAEGGSGSNGSMAGFELFDGDPWSCLQVTAGSGDSGSSSSSSSSNSSAAEFELRFGRPYRIEAVRLLAGGAAPQAVAITTTTTTSSTSPVLCRRLFALQPWQPQMALCADGPVVADRLLIRREPDPLATPSAAAAAAPPGEALELCELELFGLPA